MSDQIIEQGEYPAVSCAALAGRSGPQQFVAAWNRKHPEATFASLAGGTLTAQEIVDAWDRILAKAGGSLEREHAQHIAAPRIRELQVEVDKLRAENASLRRIIRENDRNPYRVDL